MDTNLLYQKYFPDEESLKPHLRIFEKARQYMLNKKEKYPHLYLT